MNIYFFDPTHMKEELLEEFLDLLKVHIVYNCCDELNINELRLSQKCISINAQTYDNKLHEVCAYKIVNEILNPTFKGTKIANVNPLKDYSDSYAWNPIHNIEVCPDQNIIFLIPSILSYVYPNDLTLSITKYAYNIIHKYAHGYNFEKKICYCEIRINDLLDSHSTIFRFNQFNPLFDNSGEDYLLSYLAYRTLEKRKINKVINKQLITSYIDTLEYFLKSEYYDKHADMIIDQIYSDCECRPCYNDNDSFYDECKDELNYITENGGDWILD